MTNIIRKGYGKYYIFFKTTYSSIFPILPMKRIAPVLFSQIAKTKDYNHTAGF